METNIRKWYIGYQSAENTEDFIIDLSDSEVDVIKRFLDAERLDECDWCGSTGIYNIDNGFNTREEALEYWNRGCYFPNDDRTDKYDYTIYKTPDGNYYAEQKKEK